MKTAYLHRKVNRRVDYLVDVLFCIEEDNFFDYKRKSLLPNIDKKSIQRHEKGMNIPIENITVSYLQYYMTDFIDIIIEAK